MKWQEPRLIGRAEDGGVLERMGAMRPISDAKPWIEDPKIKMCWMFPK